MKGLSLTCFLLFFFNIISYAQNVFTVYDTISSHNNIDPKHLTKFKGNLLFQASDTTDNELWISDGTLMGTHLLKNINSQQSSFPESFYENDGKLFFTAGGNGIGRELFVTDGTPNGTKLIKDIQSGTINNSGLFNTNFVGVGNTVFFYANDGIHDTELWKSDGTSAGTVMVKDIAGPGHGRGLRPNDNMIAFKGELYFIVDDRNIPEQLWKTDGTDTGTVLFLDPFPLSREGMANFTIYQGEMYFTAPDIAHGYEIWKTDGTQAGTKLAVNILPDTTFSLIPPSVDDLFVFNNELYFTAGPVDSTYTTMGRELCKFDGNSWELIKDINPGLGFGIINPEYFVFQNELYFSAIDTTGNKPELWKTDGTEMSTVKVLSKNYNPLFEDIRLTSGTELRGKFYFYHQMQLWESDGTEPGTRQISDQVPGLDPLWIPFQKLVTNWNAVWLNGYVFSSLWGNKLWSYGAVNAGLKKMNIERTNLFPNPAESYVNLSDSKGSKYKIVDQKGVQLLQGKVTSSGQVDINALDPGTYLIIIENQKGGLRIGKLIKI